MTDHTLHARPSTGVRLLTLAMLTAPVLLAAGTAVLPDATNERHGADRAKTLQVLTDAAAHRTGLLAGLLLVCFGLAVLVPAAVGLATRAPDRAGAAVGTALVAIGAPMGVATNAISLAVLHRVTDTAVPRSSAVDVLARPSGASGAVLFLLYLLVPIGFITIAVSLRRGRVLGWPAALLVGLGPVLGLAAPEGVVGAVATLPFLAGMVLAARRPG